MNRPSHDQRNLMDTVTAPDQTAPDQKALAAQLVQAREELVAIAHKLRAVDEELEGHAGERRQHQLLLDVCGSLQKLEDAGGAELFWGEGLASASAEHIARMRARIDAFGARIAEIEERRQALVDQVKEQQERTDLFEDELYEAQAEEERRNQEWIVERAISELPARKLVLPWTRGGEDDRRFRKSLGTALLICLLFVLIVPMIHLPVPAPEDAPKVPERVVRLLM